MVLDEATFWAGEASTDNVPAGAPANIAGIRRLLLAGEIAAANELTNAVTGRKLNYGTHLRLGNLRVVFDNSLEGLHGYRRDLDLDSGMAGVDYEWDGHHSIESFSPAIRPRCWSPASPAPGPTAWACVLARRR